MKGGRDTQTVSVEDKYFRDNVCDTIWEKNTVRQAVGKKPEVVGFPDPQGPEDPVRYLTNGCSFRLADGDNKQYQTFQTVPDTYPTVCMYVYEKECVLR